MITVNYKQTNHIFNHYSFIYSQISKVFTLFLYCLRIQTKYLTILKYLLMRLSHHPNRQIISQTLLQHIHHILSFYLTQIALQLIQISLSIKHKCPSIDLPTYEIKIILQTLKRFKYLADQWFFKNLKFLFSQILTSSPNKLSYKSIDMFSYLERIWIRWNKHKK